MKLNIGCGARRLPGYIGVDAVAGRPACDIVATAESIPLPDGSVSEIIAIHLWEHFYRFDCDKIITEWKRLLKPGGRLVLEMPNLIKACENILSGKFVAGKHPDQLGMWACWGDPREGDPFMAHRWGWSPQTITDFLSEHGFKQIQEKPTQFHPAGKQFRDMRIEAVRG